jgi:hypothetical protein
MIVLSISRSVWRSPDPESFDILYEDVPSRDPLSREPKAFLVIAVDPSEVGRRQAGWICVLLHGRIGWITPRAGDTVIP